MPSSVGDDRARRRSGAETPQLLASGRDARPARWRSCTSRFSKSSTRSWAATGATNDGSNHEEPRVGIEHITSNLPGRWRQDPISLIPLALGAKWGEVKPFVLTSGRQFRAPQPPALSSAAYAVAYEEVQRLGGDGKDNGTPTERTADQTHIGIFWAYDGTPSLCAPPRLYTQIAVTIADRMGTSGVEFPRLLALVNVAMADAGIAIWESKYFYDYWRPVIGIREADPGTGPTGLGDGNDRTEGDENFSPLGAPASNLPSTPGGQPPPNFTPPFPAYPSGHAGFGGALFETLRLFYGRDDIAFTFISDEFNGVTKDNEGNVRPLMPRRHRGRGLNPNRTGTLLVLSGRRLKVTRAVTGSGHRRAPLRRAERQRGVVGAGGGAPAQRLEIPAGLVAALHRRPAAALR